MKLLKELMPAFYEGEHLAKVLLSQKRQNRRRITGLICQALAPKTMESMIAAGATGLVIEAGRTLLVEKEKTLALADAHNITIVAR